jgi:uncharacterized integral membrane protein (TIGR00697 family)
MNITTNNPNHRYLSYVQGAFITILLVINLIGASKVSILQFHLPWQKDFSMLIGTGILFFPISYLIGDILTEIYGYAASRKVIWTSFGCLIFANIMVQLILWLPPSPDWPHQKAFEETLGISWRISGSSIIAFAAGEFVNSYILAKIKVWTRGSFLWFRAIASTSCGEALDTLIFYPLAFWGNPDFPSNVLLQLMVVNYSGKVLWEVLATPLTYLIVNWLKKAENYDHYDLQTDFNPFKTN